MGQPALRPKPQRDNPDRCRDNLHREGAENLSNLYGGLVATRWPVAAAWPSSLTGQGAGVLS